MPANRIKRMAIPSTSTRARLLFLLMSLLDVAQLCQKRNQIERGCMFSLHVKTALQFPRHVMDFCADSFCVLEPRVDIVGWKM